MMSTGFQATIKGGKRKQGLILYRAYGINLGMRTTKFVMVTLTNNPVLMYNNATNQWICPIEAQTLSGQLKTAAHVFFILLSQLTLPLLLFLNMLQNHATLREIHIYLQREVAQIYSGGEINSLVNIIMEHCGHPSPSHIVNPQHQPGAAIVAQIKEIVTDIHTHRPIQYILGETLFHDLTLHIDENGLIPRPETEELVDRIIKGTKDPPGFILDLCTGSGAIALALKKAFPDSHVTGLDNSLLALNLARKNSEINQLEVEWIQGDILTAETSLFTKKYDLVVSNPPYVMKSEKALMEKNVLDFEPHSALFVEDADPLIFYSAIANLSGKILLKGASLWFEINERFGQDLTRLMVDSGFTQITIHKDIHEKDRFIEVKS